MLHVGQRECWIISTALFGRVSISQGRSILYIFIWQQQTHRWACVAVWSSSKLTFPHSILLIFFCLVKAFLRWVFTIKNLKKLQDSLVMLPHNVHNVLYLNLRQSNMQQCWYKIFAYLHNYLSTEHIMLTNSCQQALLLGLLD